MADIEPFSDAEVKRHVATIAEKGYVVVEDVVPRDLVAGLTQRIDELMAELEIPYGTNSFLGLQTRRIFNLLARDEIFRRLPTFARTLPIIEGVLDPECLLSSLTAIEMGPGQDVQPLHADDGSHGLPRPGPAVGAIAIWALTDFTRENGGTRVVQGSHRFDRRPKRGDAPETVQVEMPAGSVLFYNASLWHGGGQNQSGRRRLAIVNNYCAGFLRQEECQLLAIPRDQVAGFSPRLRKLIGYGTYRGLLGHVDQQNPETLVDPDATTDMVWSRIGG